MREEVSIEELTDAEIVVLAPEPYAKGERLTLEIPDGWRRQVSVRVRESRPAVVADGPIRHRLSLAIEHSGDAAAVREGGER